MPFSFDHLRDLGLSVPCAARRAMSPSWLRIVITERPSSLGLDLSGKYVISCLRKALDIPVLSKPACKKLKHGNATDIQSCFCMSLDPFAEDCCSIVLQRRNECLDCRSCWRDCHYLQALLAESLTSSITLGSRHANTNLSWLQRFMSQICKTPW